MQWSRLILQAKNRVVDTIASSATGVINLLNIELTDVFKTKQC